MPSRSLARPRSVEKVMVKALSRRSRSRGYGFILSRFTPYSRSNRDLARFLETLDGCLSYAVDDVCAILASPLDLRTVCWRAHGPGDFLAATRARPVATVTDSDDAQPGAIERSVGDVRG